MAVVVIVNTECASGWAQSRVLVREGMNLALRNSIRRDCVLLARRAALLTAFSRAHLDSVENEVVARLWSENAAAWASRQSTKTGSGAPVGQQA